MRLLLVFVFAVAACDSSYNPISDMSMRTDLAQQDFGSSGLSCKDTEACASACTATNINTCIPACIQQVDIAGKPFFMALEACSGPACTVSDGGTGPCVAPNSADCATCVMQKCASELAGCLAH